MKKIMFNDALGLTQAVLEGRKTQTRRVATYEDIKCPNNGWALEGKGKGKRVLCKGEQVVAMSAYAKGEVVAIAQSYENIVKEYEAKAMYASAARLDQLYSRCPGWTNKMFVKADWMLHHIKIIDIKIERLQDISEEDCIKEGIYKENPYDLLPLYKFHGSRCFPTAYGAYEELINKLDKRMWKQNPLVWVYEFKLVD